MCNTLNNILPMFPCVTYNETGPPMFLTCKLSLPGSINLLVKVKQQVGTITQQQTAVDLRCNMLHDSYSSNSGRAANQL